MQSVTISEQNRHTAIQTNTTKAEEKSVER